MPLGFLISAIVIGVLLAIVHALTVFLKKGGAIFVIFGILLHTALFFVLFFGGALMEVIALAMMFSLLVYVSLSFIKYFAAKLVFNSSPVARSGAAKVQKGGDEQ